MLVPAAGGTVGSPVPTGTTIISGTGAGPSGLGPHSNLYVKGLPPECGEGMLLSLFQPHGTILSVRLVTQPNKAPFAFIKYGSVHEAAQAIMALNGVAFAGSILEVRYADSDVGSHPERTAPPSDNIFVRGLAPGCTEDDLRALFCSYGLVVSARVLHHGEQSGQGAAALVRMASVEEASHAVLALNGQRVPGAVSPLLVRFADNMEIKARKLAKQQVLPLQAGSALRLATVADGSLMASALAGQSATPFTTYQQVATGGDGTAVYMTTGTGGLIPAQQQAYDTTTGMTLLAVPTSSGGIRYTAQPAAGALLPAPMPSQAVMLQPSGSGPRDTSMLTAAPAGGLTPTAAAALMSAAYGPTGTTSLYVRNMPEDAGKLWLYERFAPFGAIQSVKVLADDSGKSRCSGFVNFADALCAAKAVAALNNTPAGDRLLHVAFQMQRK